MVSVGVGVGVGTGIGAVTTSSELQLQNETILNAKRNMGFIKIGLYPNLDNIISKRFNGLFLFLPNEKGNCIICLRACIG
jgi:hypothetical protein